MHANSRRCRQTPAKCAIANLLRNIGGYVVTRPSCQKLLVLLLKATLNSALSGDQDFSAKNFVLSYAVKFVFRNAITQLENLKS